MAQQRQTYEQLGVKDGDTIVIQGKVSFARIDKLIEGDALAEENKRRQSTGRIVTGPFRTITIEEPSVTQGANTPLAQYYAQRIYTAKASGKPALTIESKSPFPPKYGHMQNGVLVEIEDPKRNPNTGQVVSLIIRAYKPKNFANIGSSFDAIIFPEGPIEFYEGSNVLAGYGKSLGIPVRTLDSAQPKPVEPQNNTGLEQPNIAEGFGQTQQQAFEQAQPQQGFGQAPFGNGFGIQDNQLGNSGQKTDTPFS